VKSIRWLLILALVFLAPDCAEAGTYSLNLRYQPVKEFPSLQQKIGTTLAMAPFKDERTDTVCIGAHANFQGDFTYFRSDPFPLERAIQESLSNAFSRYGVKTIPIRSWDGQPESLKNMGADSVLMIEIKRFWTDGKGSLFGTNVKTIVQLVIHLGVKKEGKVFTRNVETEKEMTVPRSTPERVESVMNAILTEIFDAYFSNPY
jgi:hypothetical protein